MYTKYPYNTEEECTGRGRRRGRRKGRRGFGRRAQYDARMETPRGRGYGRRGGSAPHADFVDDASTFGPPPWAGRGRMQADPAVAEEADASFGRGMRRRMWADADISLEDQRAWLQARKQRLERRLAETEAELAQLDAPESDESAI